MTSFVRHRHDLSTHTWSFISDLSTHSLLQPIGTTTIFPFPILEPVPVIEISHQRTAAHCCNRGYAKPRLDASPGKSYGESSWSADIQNSFPIHWITGLSIKYNSTRFYQRGSRLVGDTLPEHDFAIHSRDGFMYKFSCFVHGSKFIDIFPP